MEAHLVLRNRIIFEITEVTAQLTFFHAILQHARLGDCIPIATASFIAAD